MKFKILKRGIASLLVAVLLCGAMPVLATEMPACTTASGIHTWYTKVLKERTCTDGGSYTYSCVHCKYEQTPIETDPLGHSLNETLTRPATTTQEGIITNVCLRCGDVSTRTIPKLESAPETGTDQEEDNGSNSTGQDSEMGESGDPSDPEENQAHIHSWYYEVETATCTQVGRRYRTCKVCGTEETLSTTDKRDHSYCITVVRNATAKQNGLRRYDCTVCGDSYTEVIPTIGTTGTNTGTEIPTPPQDQTACIRHNWRYTSEKATCLQEAKYIQICETCGFSEVYTTSPALGHRYTSKVTRVATVELEGERTYTCQTCGDSYTEAIEKIPQAAVATKTGLRDSGSTTMKKLSQEEIKALLLEAPVKRTGGEFVAQPSCEAPFVAGTVKDSALQDAMDRLNALRRIAGLPSAKLDEEYNDVAQHGAVLIATLGYLEHYPSKLSGMSENFYRRAYDATSTGNLSSGSSLTAAVDSFMDDSDSSNINRLGHRRWQLNPTLGKVGFGYAVSDKFYRHFVVEKVHDQSGAGCDYDFISWPASGNFPSELFSGDMAWSISLDPEQYSVPKIGKIVVTVTRDSDGKRWSFSSSSSDGYFNVNLGSFGISNCIIFRPDNIAAYSGTYTVRVEGLTAKNGQAVKDFRYRVDFFNTTEDFSSSADEVFTGNTAADNLESPGIVSVDVPGQTVFRDVPANHWANEYIQTASALEIVSGYGNGMFGPEDQVTGAQFCAMLANAFYADDLLYAVKDENWWTPGVLTNQSHGILYGTKMEAQYKLLGAYGSQLNTAITRYDMAQMMYNILWDYGATLPEVAEKNVARRSIKDWDSIPSAYQEAVVTCYGLGLLSGYPDGTFGGQNRMNRAQGCVVILKLLDFVS